MSKKKKRITKMLEIITTQRYATIPELAASFEVSEMTIRRDLEVLEGSGMIKVVRGTAIPNADINQGIISSPEYNLVVEVGVNTIEKSNIGKFAVSLIKPGDSIILDTGTTTEQIAKNIPLSIPIKVMCINLNNLLQLKNKGNVELMVAGGSYKQNTQLFTSEMGVNYIQGFRFNKAFISAAGLHPKYGITCKEGYEVPMKKAMISAALEKILVLDSSKLGKVENAYFADLSEIDSIITNGPIPDEWKETFRQMGKKLYLV